MTEIISQDLSQSNNFVYRNDLEEFTYIIYMLSYIARTHVVFFCIALGCIYQTCGFLMGQKV